jgi:hypothetical protein
MNRHGISHLSSSTLKANITACSRGATCRILVKELKYQLKVAQEYAFGPTEVSR